MLTHVDDDGLPGAGDIDLAGRGDVEVLQVALQLGIGGLEVKEGLPSGNGRSVKRYLRGPGSSSRIPTGHVELADAAETAVAVGKLIPLSPPSPLQLARPSS